MHMEFGSWEAVGVFYNAYAKQGGFSISETGCSKITMVKCEWSNGYAVKKDFVILNGWIFLNVYVNHAHIQEKVLGNASSQLRSHNWKVDCEGPQIKPHTQLGSSQTHSNFVVTT
ncbi:hypothetical protein LINPERPRIM_LOCUS4991 [Linum perenne]